MGQTLTPVVRNILIACIVVLGGDARPIRPDRGRRRRPIRRTRPADQGQRHPVTAGLTGANHGDDDEATWGRWFRLVQSQVLSGQTLMSGAEQQPLLVLADSPRDAGAQPDLAAVEEEL